MQNELYVNLSMGTPKQEFKSVLKMDKYGFLIYNDALNYNLSTSYEEVEEDLTISWVYSYTSVPSKDNFYLSSFNSYKDLNNFISKNQPEKMNNITKTNKITFLRIYPKKNESHYFNNMFNNYGIIGLKYNDNPNFNSPEFILGLKAIKEINSYTFSLKFENNLKNGFADNNNKGYFIFGEELTDDEQEKNEINYANCEVFKGELAWNLNFDNIYSKINDIGKNNDEMKKNFVEFKGEKKIAEIIVNYPYLIGTSEFFKYINETFFNKLIEQNICQCINVKKYRNFYSYSCDSKSKYFIDYLNSYFPDLVFEHKLLGINFTLNKNDLFSYNNFDNLDTNLYFLIMESTGVSVYNNWILGIPFLKKYRLSFNYDKKNIGFYINDGIDKKIKKKENSGFNFFESIIFKIIVITILIIIIFVLGVLFQKKFQKTRKKKANELDDGYEYETYKEQINNNINDNNTNNKIGTDSIN